MDTHEYRFGWNVQRPMMGEPWFVEADKLEITSTGVAVFSRQFQDDYHPILVLQPNDYASIFQNSYVAPAISAELTRDPFKDLASSNL